VVAISLTIKPGHYFMRARLRDPHFVDQADTLGGAPETKTSEKKIHHHSKVDNKAKLLPMKIVCGSNAGTAAALTQGPASSAPEYGFTASVPSLNEGVSALGKICLWSSLLEATRD